ncbi:MAG: hypothetical protein LW650_14040 [Planctomycetaceae bacterium]|jgi:hypothetical protein|nr:hypothetical protein [Phycisphaerales bacterium]MCE2654520.1 hypothetical protein [Planctomycetaceae bacterium]
MRCVAPLSVVVLSVSALLTGGCDNKSAPVSATGPDNPSTMYGKSAKMARDLKSDIQAGQTAALNQAAGITGESAAVGAFEVGGITFGAPAGWTRQPSGGMRAAQFSVPSRNGPDTAEVVFFGGVGGSEEDNIARWKRQVAGPGGPGGQPGSFSQTTFNVGTLKVTRVAMDGTYTGMSASGGAAAPIANARFVAAIISGGAMPVQVRMTGPANTVSDAEKDFDQMIKSMTLK